MAWLLAHHAAADRAGPPPRPQRGFDIALCRTDPDAADEEVIADHAGRWPIETAFGNGKQHTGAGQVHNRVQAAVERTTPFALPVQSLTIAWHAPHGNPAPTPAGASAKRRGAGRRPTPPTRTWPPRSAG
jgi:hypothetical protein